MKWNRKSVLVTGGASFIGSHLVEELVNRGASVVVADNFSSGVRSNLSSVADQIEVKIGDLRDPAFTEKVMQDVDVVFHLAAVHGGRGFIATHPADCALNMALDGTVMDYAHKKGVERICFASSACVYPKSLQTEDRTTLLLREDMADPFHEGKAFADEEYGWAKFMGEMTLGAFHRQYGVQGVSCRIFTSYGPRENETHAVIALIAKSFARADPYEIWGTGEQDRNFTFVSDTVEGLIRSSERIDDCSPINIGTSEHVKIKEVANTIFELTDFHPNEVNFDTSKPQGVYSRAADNTRCRDLLDWEPKTKLDEGLRQAIDWYFATKERRHVQEHIEQLLFQR